MKFLEDIDRLQSLVQSTLDEAKTKGATAAEVGLGIESGLSVTARLGEAETVEHHSGQGLSVTVYHGQRKGSASTTDLSVGSIKEVVAAACSFARYGSEDPYSGLPDSNWLAHEFPDLDLYHPWQINAETAIELAVNCENFARTFHSDITNSEGATVNSHRGIRILGNSLGFLHATPSTRHSIVCSVLGSRNDNMQRDYWYSVARDPEKLDSVETVGRTAAERVLKRLEGTSLSTRQCPVMFAAEVASGLVGAFISAISGGNLYRKSSFLLDSIGNQVFPEFFHIHEQPYLESALGSASYDAEGVATRTRDIICDGIVQGYLLSSYSARKLNMQSTGNAGGVHNLTVEPGTEDFQGMLKLMNTGFLVTELMGQGVNMVTGDYSRGAAGFWVENGEIKFPVEEVTIAGNLKEMYKKIVAVGDDVDYRNNIRTGSILIDRMSIAGK